MCYKMEPLFELRATDYWNKFVKHEQPRAGPSPCAAAPASRKLRSSDVVYEIPPNYYWNALRNEEDETGIKEWSAPLRKQDPTKPPLQLQNATIQTTMQSGDWSDGSSAVWERFLALEEEEALVDVDELVNELGAGNEEEKDCDSDAAPGDCVDNDILDDLSLSDLTDTMLNFLCADQKFHNEDKEEQAMATADCETSS